MGNEDNVKSLIEKETQHLVKDSPRGFHSIAIAQLGQLQRCYWYCSGPSVYLNKVGKVCFYGGTQTTVSFPFWGKPASRQQSVVQQGRKYGSGLATATIQTPTSKRGETVEASRRSRTTMSLFIQFCCTDISKVTALKFSLRLLRYNYWAKNWYLESTGTTAEKYTE